MLLLSMFICARAEAAFRDVGLGGWAESASVMMVGDTVTPAEVTSIHHSQDNSCKLLDLCQSLG